jgi:hypothetical protein
MAARTSDNQAIVDRMLVRARAGGLQSPAPRAAASDCSGFDLENFAVTYPNEELMALVEVAGAPAGVTLLGATIVATPSAASNVVYCLSVVANSAGLQLPLSLLAASTSPSFGKPTPVTGLVVLCFTRDGSSQEQCTVSRVFTVGD